MIKLDDYGNELSGRGVIRTDSGKYMDVDASEYMTESKLLKKYFPSKILIATEAKPGYGLPIKIGDKYVIVDGEEWSLCDLVTTPRPYSSLGIKIFQFKDSE